MTATRGTCSRFNSCQEGCIDRDAFVAQLMKAGIGTSVHFIPLHRHPYWRDTYDLRDDDFPVATDVYRRTLSLPIYSAMTPEQTERVVQAVRRVCHDHSH
jgi:dTDP-4-amino-4,6-dideoxygalactose transaminase